MVAASRLDGGANLGCDRNASVEGGRDEAHPLMLDLRQMLGDHVIAGMMQHELEHARGIAFVLVTRPRRIMRTRADRVPPIEEYAIHGGDEILQSVLQRG